MVRYADDGICVQIEMVLRLSPTSLALTVTGDGNEEGSECSAVVYPLPPMAE